MKSEIARVSSRGVVWPAGPSHPHVGWSPLTCSMRSQPLPLPPRNSSSLQSHFVEIKQ